MGDSESAELSSEECLLELFGVDNQQKRFLRCGVSQPVIERLIVLVGLISISTYDLLASSQTILLKNCKNVGGYLIPLDDHQQRSVSFKRFCQLLGRLRIYNTHNEWLSDVFKPGGNFLKVSFSLI